MKTEKKSLWSSIQEPRNLLWVDCSAGAVVGILVLALSVWLSKLYQLPHSFVLFMGGANLAYAAYSFSLARRATRPKALLWLLIAANLTWGVLCFWWAFSYWGTASVFGLAQLLGEGIFVGGLACVEWRWRELLLTA